MKSRKIIAGVDEVGRGSLIGSVYSAAVILPDHGFSLKLDDSKKLTCKSRRNLANRIIKESMCISIGVATKDEIDSLNIHHATLLSMKRAVYNLNIEPTTIGAITKGKVCTPLKKDLKGKELSRDKANKNPKLNSKNKVTTANLIERHMELKKTSSNISCL